MPGVIRFTTLMDNDETIAFPRAWGGRSLRVEAPTGYLGVEFDRIVTYVPDTGKTSDDFGKEACQSDVLNGCIKNVPVIFSIAKESIVASEITWPLQWRPTNSSQFEFA